MPDPGPRAGVPPLARSYLSNDARFAIPAGWEDRSVIMLTAPAVDGDGHGGDDSARAPAAPPGFSVTLHRDAPQPGEDVPAYVARQMTQLETAIPDVDVLRQGARVVGGVPGWEVEFRWMAAQGRLRQHQVHVLRDGPEGPRVLTWTATAPAARYGNYADQFAELIDSVRFVAPSFGTPPAAG